MKNWLAQLRISFAFDSGRPLPEALREKIAADHDLGNFARQIENFPAARPAFGDDSALHDSIMRAVRSSVCREEPRPNLSFGWFATTAAVVFAAILYSTHRKQITVAAAQPLETPAALLQMGEQIPTTVPSMMMAPLSNEWASVNRDVQDTKKILLSSVPF